MSQSQEQRRKRKKKLHEKHKERRKDVRVHMPFIIAYMGDPARHYRCGMMYFRNYFDLTPIWRNCRGEKFARLALYKKRRVQEIKGIVYIKNAP